MFAFAPPVKVARKQRTFVIRAGSLSAPSVPPSLSRHRTGGTVDQQQQLQQQRLDLFQAHDVLRSFTGRHAAFVIARSARSEMILEIHTWLLQPTVPHTLTSFAVPAEMRGATLFFGEGPAGRSVLLMSSTGLVAQIELLGGKTTHGSGHPPTDDLRIHRLRVDNQSQAITYACAVDGTLWAATEDNTVIVSRCGEGRDFEAVKAEVSQNTAATNEAASEAESKKSRKSGWFSGWWGSGKSPTEASTDSSTATSKPRPGKTYHASEDILSLFPSTADLSLCVVECKTHLFVAHCPMVSSEGDDDVSLPPSSHHLEGLFSHGGGGDRWHWQKHSNRCVVHDAVLLGTDVWILSNNDDAPPTDDNDDTNVQSNTNADNKFDVSVCSLKTPNQNQSSVRIAVGELTQGFGKRDTRNDVAPMLPSELPPPRLHPLGQHGRECALVTTFSTVVVSVSTGVHSPTQKEVIHEHTHPCIVSALDRSDADGAVFVFSSNPAPQVISAMAGAAAFGHGSANGSPHHPQSSTTRHQAMPVDSATSGAPQRNQSALGAASANEHQIRLTSLLTAHREQIGRDAEWLGASEDICNCTRANPHNWAKGNIDADDLNLLLYIRQSIDTRFSQHHDLLTALLHRPGAWDELQAETRALLISRQEQLAVLGAIRDFQNAENLNDIRLIESREEFFRDVVSNLANALRAQQQQRGLLSQMSSTEVCFNFVHHCTPLLEAVNEKLRRVAESFGSVEELVNAAVVSAQAWLSCVDAIEDFRGELPAAAMASEDPAQRAALWTLVGGQAGFEQLLITQCMMLSDVLKRLVVALGSQQAHLPSAIDEHTEQTGLLLGDSLGSLLRATLRLNSNGPGIGPQALRRTLLCEPFLSRPVGYPFGEPTAAPCGPSGSLSSSLTRDLLRLAESIALEFNIVEILWDFGGATCVTDLLRPGETPADVPEHYEKLRSYCEQVSGMYEFSIRAMLAWHREQELSCLPDLIPVVRNGHPTRTLSELLLAEAPHAHWVVLQREGSVSTDAILQWGRSIGKGPALAETANDHRIATLGLARLALVAGGRQLGEQRKVQAESKVAVIQRQFFPDAAVAMAKEHLVQELIKLGHDANFGQQQSRIAAASASPPRDANEPIGVRALAAASALADSITDQNKRDLSLSDVLKSCHKNDGKLFDTLRADDAMSDGARLRVISESVTGKCVHASLTLRRWTMHEANRVAAETGDAFAAVLKSWARSVFAS